MAKKKQAVKTRSARTFDFLNGYVTDKREAGLWWWAIDDVTQSWLDEALGTREGVWRSTDEYIRNQYRAELIAWISTWAMASNASIYYKSFDVNGSKVSGFVDQDAVVAPFEGLRGVSL